LEDLPAVGRQELPDLSRSKEKKILRPMSTIYLASNPLITPNIGLMFWTLLVFALLLVVLRKFAWKPILDGLKNREQSIEDALSEAKRARAEMSNLKAENEQLLAQARAERDKILREAKEIREKLISDAKAQAQEEGKKLIDQAKDSIEKEKLSATKILRKELADKQQQEDLIESYINEVNVN
jgi:F-type H+-transporting ATPase subunit b